MNSSSLLYATLEPINSMVMSELFWDFQENAQNILWSYSVMKDPTVVGHNRSWKELVNGKNAG